MRYERGFASVKLISYSYPICSLADYIMKLCTKTDIIRAIIGAWPGQYGAVKLVCSSHYLTIPNGFVMILLIFHLNICTVRLAYNHFVSGRAIFMKWCRSLYVLDTRFQHQPLVL